MFIPVITQFTIEDLPDGEHQILWYNDTHKYSSKTRDFYIKYVLKNQTTGQLFAMERNIVEMPNIFLGGHIKNKKLTNRKEGRSYTFNFNIKHPQKLTRLPDKLFDKGHWYFPKRDNSIILSSGNKYPIGSISSKQKGIELQNGSRTIFFPSYVLAQYFYLRSEALSKQILSINTKHIDPVQGLYNTIHSDSHGIVDLTPSNRSLYHDSAEIARFALNPYAKQYFNSFHTDMILSNLQKKEKLRRKNLLSSSNVATLQAYFPVIGDIEITFRGIKLTENYYLALEIIRENSPYPFQKLNIIEPKGSNNKGTTTPSGTGPKKVRKIKQLTYKFSKATPNSRFQPVKVSNSILIDGRADLKNKTIQYIRSSSETKEGAGPGVENNEIDVDLGSDHEESSGDNNTAHLSAKYTLNSDEKKVIRSPGFDEFKKMLSQASMKTKRFPGFTYEISELFFPKTFDEAGNLCLRTLLSDNITCRKYLIATILFKGQSYTVIDLQKDRRISTISTLLLTRNDSLQIAQDTIEIILQTFALTKKTWLEEIHQDELIYKPLKHAQTCDEDAIALWVKRFRKALKNSPDGWFA